MKIKMYIELEVEDKYLTWDEKNSGPHDPDELKHRPKWYMMVHLNRADAFMLDEKDIKIIELEGLQ